MRENENALRHVKKLIEDLSNDVSSTITVDGINYAPYSYIARVYIDDKKHKIEFERSIIDDLEVAIEKYKNSIYLDTLESTIKFSIYIELGRENLLKDFNISSKLISDKRDWIKDYRVDTNFSPELTDILYKGLKKLINSFNSQINKHKSLEIDFSEIEENKDWAQSLIDYYDTHRNLNSIGVGTKNFQFLKAAALQQIITLENMKKSETMPATLKAVNKKIYDIVIALRKDPFLEIKLPDFIHDVAEEYLKDEKAK